MTMTTLSSKNQITLPADVRAYLHAKPGDKIMINVEGMHAVLRAVPSGKRGDVKRMSGMLKPYYNGPKIDIKEAVKAHAGARDERSKRR